MAGATTGGRELDQTPTWAVTVVCAAIVIISLLMEKGLHWLGHFFTKKRKVSLFEALEKVKAELMVLGFISLLLSFTTNYIAKICIPEKAADTMLPCKLRHDDEVKTYDEDSKDTKGRHLWEEDFTQKYIMRRFLAAAAGNSCPYGKVPLVSPNGIHQLHIFIFFLAVFHVISSGLIMALGRAKIRGWKEWERGTESAAYEFSSDPARFHSVQEISFVKQHMSFWNRVSFSLYISSFFRQFYRSVRKEDYLIMRHGFINAHLAPGSKFNFQRYIRRSLEDDFKVVFGISPILWASGGVFLLLNVSGWYMMFWISLIPLLILLAVGTKLQAIITKMAMEIHDRHVLVQGMPIVSLGDRHFWFKSPRLVLFLIHFTLFQNAFQLIYFLWIWHSFGLKSCFHENRSLLLARICLGIFVEILASYVTLPLYALVSQLGSSMKSSIFDEQTTKALKKWHLNAKKNHKKSVHSLPGTPGMTPPCSPPRLLQRFKTIGHSGPAMVSSPTKNSSDHDMSDTKSHTAGFDPGCADLEMGPATSHRYTQDHYESESKDFSFVKVGISQSKRNLQQ